MYAAASSASAVLGAVRERTETVQERAIREAGEQRRRLIDLMERQVEVMEEVNDNAQARFA